MANKQLNYNYNDSPQQNYNYIQTTAHENVSMTTTISVHNKCAIPNANKEGRESTTTDDMTVLRL